MSRRSLAILSEGMLSDSQRRSLTLLSLGWLELTYVPEEPKKKKKKGGGIPWDIVNPNKKKRKDREKEFRLKEERELLAIIRTFMLLQN
jgi:hypothetical protein